MAMVAPAVIELTYRCNNEQTHNRGSQARSQPHPHRTPFGSTLPSAHKTRKRRCARRTQSSSRSWTWLPMSRRRCTGPTRLVSNSSLAGLRDCGRPLRSVSEDPAHYQIPAVFPMCMHAESRARHLLLPCPLLAIHVDRRGGCPLAAREELDSAARTTCMTSAGVLDPSVGPAGQRAASVVTSSPTWRTRRRGGLRAASNARAARRWIGARRSELWAYGVVLAVVASV